MTAGPEVKLATPTFILSIASVVITAIVSWANIRTASEQKRSELEIQKVKNEADSITSRGELVFKNIGLLNSKDANERQLAVAALVYTLGDNEAKKLLASVEKFGPESVQGFITKARTDISKAEAQRSANINFWQGKWSYTFAGRNLDQKGSLQFTFDRDGTVRGEFHAASPSTLQGRITTAALSDDGTTLSGTWWNSNNQSGRFSFQLKDSTLSPESSDPAKFSGNYSMGTALPVSGSANTWSGTKE